MHRQNRRSFLKGTLAGGVAFACHGAASSVRAVGPNDQIRVAVLGMGGHGGVGGRGRQLLAQLKRIPECRIAALCDVDQQLLAEEAQKLEEAGTDVKKFSDMHQAFSDRDIDAVFVALPNHWHALATIWACQAGKDVYVEKPASYDLWEGRQMVAAARRENRIVQVGTQARTDDATIQAVDFLQAGKLGKIRYAHAVIYRRRESIGKVTGPQPIPAHVDYDQWLGPAPRTELLRTELHYDWHWDWATGNGEIGNNGVHYLDRCRWALGETKLPPRSLSVGGRFNFDDDGKTPNTQIAFLDYPSAPIICEVRGMPAKQGSRAMDRHRGIGMGILIQCEDGAVVIERGVTALDHGGQVIQKFEDRGERRDLVRKHQENFFASMRSRNAADLTSEVENGHLSAGLCHLPNLSHRIGEAHRVDRPSAPASASAEWRDVVERFEEHLASNGVDLSKTPATVGPWVELDPATETFVGEYAAEAERLSRRAEYRGRYVVPNLA